MNTFEITAYTCTACGRIDTPPWTPFRCVDCGNATFGIEIERSASGVEVAVGNAFGGMVGTFVDLASDDAGDGSVYYRTHAFLRCEDVTGEEIVRFLGAPIEERRRLYVVWKRREIESRLGGDEAVCGRCRVSFKVYANGWNRAGFCSRTCRSAELKSLRV